VFYFFETACVRTGYSALENAEEMTPFIVKVFHLQSELFVFHRRGHPEQILNPDIERRSEVSYFVVTRPPSERAFARARNNSLR
jgi:hypothetical protein